MTAGANMFSVQTYWHGNTALAEEIAQRKPLIARIDTDNTPEDQ